MTTVDYTDLPLIPKRRFGPLGWLGTIVSSWRRAARRRRTMQDVAALDAHLLRDIGLDFRDIDRGALGKHRSIWLNPMRNDHQ